MCFFNMPSPKIDTRAPATPTRDESANLSQIARLNARRARGVTDTVATSPLGDPGFGTSIRKPTLLGQTA